MRPCCIQEGKKVMRIGSRPDAPKRARRSTGSIVTQKCASHQWFWTHACQTVQFSAVRRTLATPEGHPGDPYALAVKCRDLVAPKSSRRLLRRHFGRRGKREYFGRRTHSCSPGGPPFAGEACFQAPPAEAFKEGM